MANVLWALEKACAHANACYGFLSNGNSTEIMAGRKAAFPYRPMPPTTTRAYTKLADRGVTNLKTSAGMRGECTPPGDVSCESARKSNGGVKDCSRSLFIFHLPVFCVSLLFLFSVTVPCHIAGAFVPRSSVVRATIIYTATLESPTE